MTTAFYENISREPYTVSPSIASRGAKSTSMPDVRGIVFRRRRRHLGA